MESLIPVFVAVFLAETGGRIQALTAALRRRFPESSATIFAVLVLTSLASLITAAIGGAIISEMIDFRARTLLCGLALVFAGIPMLLSMKRPKLPEAALFAASFRAFIPAQFGNASQFIVFAMAALGTSPIFTFASGMVAILVATSIPLLLADEWPGKLLVSVIRKVAGVILLLVGATLATIAFRVI